MVKPKRMISCIRVSTDAQGDAGGIETQQRENRAYADKHGFIIVAEVVDRISGTVPFFDRPSGKVVYEHIKNKTADGLIFWRLDRATRDDDTVDIHVIRRDLRLAGMELHWTDKGKSDLSSAVGSLSDHLSAIFAAEERTKIKERLLGGKVSKVLRGSVHVSGRAPYGYKLIRTNEVVGGRRFKKETLEIDDETSNIVRLIFDWYAVKNMPIYAITQRLRELGVNTQSGRNNGYRAQKSPSAWVKSSVWRILQNEVYIGKWYFRKFVSEAPAHGRTYGRKVKRDKSEWIQIEIPSIIDLDTWTVAQSKLLDNRINAQRNTKNEYLLRGLMKCQYCGKSVIGKADKTTKRYCCINSLSSVDHDKCPMPSVPLIAVESAVWQIIVSNTAMPDTVSDEAAIEPVQPDYTKIIEALKSEKEKLIDLYARTNILTLQAFEARVADIDAKITVAEDEQETVAIQRSDDRQRTKAQGEFAMIKDQWVNGGNDLPFGDKREVLQLVGLKLHVNADDTHSYIYGESLIWNGTLKMWSGKRRYAAKNT